MVVNSDHSTEEVKIDATIAKVVRRVVLGVAFVGGVAAEAFALTNCNDYIAPNGRCTLHGVVTRLCCNSGSNPVLQQSCQVNEYYDGLGDVYWNGADHCFNPGVSCTPFQKSCA